MGLVCGGHPPSGRGVWSGHGDPEGSGWPAEWIFRLKGENKGGFGKKVGVECKFRVKNGLVRMIFHGVFLGLVQKSGKNWWGRKNSRGPAPMNSPPSTAKGASS